MFVDYDIMNVWNILEIKKTLIKDFDMMTLYIFNKQAIKEKEKMSTSEDSFVQKNTLWEESTLHEDLRNGL